MRTTRKKRNHFAQHAPLGPFGIDEASEHNGNRRVDLKQTSPATDFTLKQVPIRQEKYLRWFTPEHYARKRGYFYHKRDKKYYPVIDTKSSNPFKRYKYYRTKYRTKRFYTTVSRKETKPYNRKVYDLVIADSMILDFGKVNVDTNLTFTYRKEDDSKWYEVWLYLLIRADSLDPLQDTGNHAYYIEPDTGEETVAAKYYAPKSAIDLGLNTREYTSPTRLEALKQWENFNHPGEDILTDFSGLLAAVDVPYGVDWTTRKYRAESFKLTTAELAYAVPRYVSDGEEPILTLREINEYVLSTGLKPDVGSPIVVHGITGPELLVQSLPSLWQEFVSFDYDRDTLLDGRLRQMIPFTDLCGLLGFKRFLYEPVRGLPALGQFIGEMPETVASFGHILSSAIKIAKALKRGDLPTAVKQVELGAKYLSHGSVKAIDVAKAAISLDLFYKFGLKPFIEDLKAISDAGDTLGDFELAGQRRRLRLNWDSCPWANRAVERTWQQPFEVTHGAYTFLGVSEYSLRLTCDQEYGAIIKVKSPYRFFFEALGLNSILSTAWELLPLSFVIDWFVDIGAVVTTLTDVDLDSFDIDQGYTTLIVSGTVDEKLVELYVNGEPVDLESKPFQNRYDVFEIDRGFYDPRVAISINGHQSGEAVTGLYEKFVTLDIFKPLRTSLLSTSKLGTMAELILQRIRS